MKMAKTRTVRSNAGKGKKSERAINKVLKKFSAKKRFSFLPLPDAHVCRGRIPKQPGDNAIFVDGEAYITDTKELEKKMYLGSDRMSQMAQMKLLKMSGVNCAFFVHQLTEDKWYVIDIESTNFKCSAKLKDFVQHDSAEEAVLWLVGKDFLGN
jgi:hypothetical protein